MFSRIASWFRVEPATQSVAGWHVGPGIDTAAYGFSWVWVLAPLVLLDDTHPFDYLAIYFLVTSLTFVHRHYTLPYVYLDSQVFGEHERRFVIFPLLMFALFAASPFLWEMTIPVDRLLGTGAAPFEMKSLIAAIVFFTGAWTYWHTYMQKYGILRMYDVKSGSPERVPGWVDRLLVLAWIPLYLVWLAPAHRAEVHRYFATVRKFTSVLLDAMEAAQPWLLVPAIGLVVFSLASFAYYEWGIRRLRNRPRLSMALGTLLISAAFLVANPIKVYMALAFSHAVEYMVFVWAFQRRRYAVPLPHDPPLARLVRRPLLAYGGFTVGLATFYILGRYWGIFIAVSSPKPELFGVLVTRWLFFWTVYQSVIHFYYDGFLWKMRLPEVRSHL
jgi:hypothetical protein